VNGYTINIIAMKSVFIKLKQYQVATSWKDVSIKQLHLLNSIYNLKLDGKKSMVEKAMYQLSILSDIPFSTLRGLSNKKLLKLMSYINFTTKQPEVDDISKFTFEGVRYECENPLQNEVLGKYIVAEHFILKSEEIIESVNNNEFKFYPKIIATIVHEKGNDYSDLDIPDREDKFQNLDCLTALGVVRFFFIKLTTLKSTIRAYLNKEQVRRSMKSTSQKNMGGMQ
jgi:hypothetical protein